MVDDLIRDSGLHIATCLGGQVYSHGAGLHAFNHVACDEDWRLLARDEGSGDDDIHILGLLPEQCHLHAIQSFVQSLYVPWRRAVCGAVATCKL